MTVIDEGCRQIDRDELKNVRSTEARGGPETEELSKRCSETETRIEIGLEQARLESSGPRNSGGFWNRKGKACQKQALCRQRQGGTAWPQPALPAPRSRRCSPSPVTMQQAPFSFWAATMAPSIT